MERNVVHGDSNIKMEVKEEPEYIYVDESVCRVKLEVSEDYLILPKGDEVEKVMADVRTDESHVLGRSHQPSRRGRKCKVFNTQRPDSVLGVPARKILPRPQIQIPNYKIPSPPISISQIQQSTSTTPAKGNKSDAGVQPHTSPISITSSKSQVAGSGGGTGRKILPRPQMSSPLVHSQPQTVPVHQLQPVITPAAQAVPLSQLQSMSPNNNCSIVPIHSLPSTLPITPLNPAPPTHIQTGIPLSPNSSSIGIVVSQPTALPQLTESLPVSSPIVSLIQPTPPVVAKNSENRKQKQARNFAHGRKLLPRPQKAMIRPPAGAVIHSQQQAALPIPHLQPLTPVSAQQGMPVHQIQPVSTPTSQNLPVPQLQTICQVSASPTIPLQQIQSISPVGGQQNVTLQPLKTPLVGNNPMSPQQVIPMSTHQAMPQCVPHTTSYLGVQQNIPAQEIQTVTSGSANQMATVQHLQTLTQGTSSQNVPAQQLQTLSSGSHQVISVQQITEIPAVSACQQTTLPQVQSRAPVSMHQTLPLQQLTSVTPTSQHQALPIQNVKTLHSTNATNGTSLQQVHSVTQDEKHVVPAQQHCPSKSPTIAPRQVKSIPPLHPIISTSTIQGIPIQSKPVHQVNSELNSSDQQVLISNEVQLEKRVVKEEIFHQKLQPGIKCPQTVHQHLAQASSSSLCKQPVTSPSRIHSSVPDHQQQDTVACVKSSQEYGQGMVLRKKTSKLPIRTYGKSITPLSKLKLKQLHQKSLLLGHARRKKPILKIMSVTSCHTKKCIQEKNLFSQAPSLSSSNNKVSRSPSQQRKIFPRPFTTSESDGNSALEACVELVGTMADSQRLCGQKAQCEVTETVKIIIIPPVTSSGDALSHMTMFIPELQLNTTSVINKTVLRDQNNVSLDMKQELPQVSRKEESVPLIQLVSPKAEADFAAGGVMSYEGQTTNSLTSSIGNVTPASVHCIADTENIPYQETAVLAFKFKSRSPQCNTRHNSAKSQSRNCKSKQDSTEFNEEYIDLSAQGNCGSVLHCSSGSKCNGVFNDMPVESKILEDVVEEYGTKRHVSEIKDEFIMPKKQICLQVETNEPLQEDPDNITLQENVTSSPCKAPFSDGSGSGLSKNLPAEDFFVFSSPDKSQSSYKEDHNISSFIPNDTTPNTSLEQSSHTLGGYASTEEVRVVDQVAACSVTPRVLFHRPSSSKQADTTIFSSPTSSTSLTSFSESGNLFLECTSSSASVTSNTSKCSAKLTIMATDILTSDHSDYPQQNDEERKLAVTSDSLAPQDEAVESEIHPKGELTPSKIIQSVSSSTASSCHTAHRNLPHHQRDLETTKGKELSEIRRLNNLVSSQRKILKKLWRRLRTEKKENKKLQEMLKATVRPASNISANVSSIKMENTTVNHERSFKTEDTNSINRNNESDQGGDTRSFHHESDNVQRENTGSVSCKSAIRKGVYNMIVTVSDRDRLGKGKEKVQVEGSNTSKSITVVDNTNRNSSIVEGSDNVANNTELQLNSSTVADSSPVCTQEEEEMKCLIQKFMMRDDVTKLCEESTDSGNIKSVRYRLHHLTVLHKRFIADCCKYCTYEMFVRHIPQNVRKCRAEDVDINICINCHNPELKIESLVKRRLMSINTNIEDIISDESVIASLISSLKSLKGRRTILTYSEWSVNTDSNSPQIPQKKTRHNALNNVVPMLWNELLVLIDHLKRVHQQYDETYKAKCEADSSPHHAVIQTEWSPLIILHSFGKNGLPEPQKVISLQCGYVWSQRDSTGFVAISGSSDRTAPALCASLETVLKKLIVKGIKTVTFITTPQTNISCVCEYGKKNKMEVRCIFSEPWHGAGMAEAVGNSITQLICDTINAGGVHMVKTAKDVFKLIRPHSNNLIYFYTDEDVHRHKEFHSSGNPAKSHNRLIKPKITVSV